MRPLGKSFEQFVSLCSEVARGKKVEVHHPDYVVMSRNRYKEVMHAAYGGTVEVIGVDDAKV